MAALEEKVLAFFKYVTIWNENGGQRPPRYEADINFGAITATFSQKSEK